MKVGDLVFDRESKQVGIIIRYDHFGLMWHILYSDGEIKCSNGGYLEAVS